MCVCVCVCVCVCDGLEGCGENWLHLQYLPQVKWVLMRHKQGFIQRGERHPVILLPQHFDNYDGMVVWRGGKWHVLWPRNTVYAKPQCPHLQWQPGPLDNGLRVLPKAFEGAGKCGGVGLSPKHYGSLQKEGLMITIIKRYTYHAL